MNEWRRKLGKLRRKRRGKVKARTREALFGEFTQKSKEIPHVDKIISKKTPHLPRLQEVAKKYVKHKEEIKPGLKREEKSVFDKLEGIANKTKKKKIDEVATKEEAKYIFSKLKNISKKRKGNK